MIKIISEKYGGILKKGLLSTSYDAPLLITIVVFVTNFGSREKVQI